MPPRMNELLQAMGLLALRRGTDDMFSVEGEPPHWFARLFPGGAGTDPFPLAERFPFLESFLPTALDYWGTRKWGRIRSGYWVETDPAGQDVPLQASAVHLEGGDYLVIENVRGVYQQETAMLQKAREGALALERAQGEERGRRALLEGLLGRVFRVRGGRFVEPLGGEQFALIEAVEELRRLRRSKDADEWVAVPAADPVNLAGVLDNAPRPSGAPRVRLVFRNGTAVASSTRAGIDWLVDLSAPEQRRAALALRADDPTPSGQPERWWRRAP